MLLINKTLVVVVFLLSPLVLRNVLDTNLGVVGGFLSIATFAIAIFYFFIKLISTFRIKRIILIPLIFVLYVLLCVVIYPFLGIVQFWITPFWGAFQLLSPLILSLVIVSYFKTDRYTELAIKFIVYVGVVNAIGGILQFYVSPNLFGLISNRVLDGSKFHVTKRAISFLASPQSLSIYLAFCLPLVRYICVNFIMKILIFCTIFFCGVLTGSKAFFVFLICYVGISMPIKYSFILLGLILFAIPIVMNFRTGIDTFDRVLDLPMKLLDLENYMTFQIWKQFVLYPSDILQVLFGRGVGVMSNFSQTFNNYQMFNGSTESFLIQLYFELGVVGLFIFLFVFIYPALRVLRVSKYRPLAYCCLALLSNMAFTPAFYGFAAASLFYFAYSICLYEMQGERFSNYERIEVSYALSK